MSNERLPAGSELSPEPAELNRTGVWARSRALRASDEVADHIRRALFEDRLHAGDPLGSELQLGQQYGVSHDTIRDAIRGLRAAGVVDIRIGVKGGVRVARPDPFRFSDALAAHLKLVGLDPLDAMEAQAGLEWVAAEQAATRAKPDELKQFERLVDESAQSLQHEAQFQQLSATFHDTVALASHNWAIITSLRNLRTIVGKSTTTKSSAAQIQRVLLDHQAIFHALAAGDGVLASQRMRDHLTTCQMCVTVHQTQGGNSLRRVDSYVAGGGLGPARVRRASDDIVSQIQHELVADRLHPGDTLGSVNDLALLFGVGRSTVREALRMLEALGLVEIRTGVNGGVRIAMGDPSLVADMLAVQLKLAGLTEPDALAAELGLEWVAAGLAAARADTADLTALGEVVARAGRVIDQLPAFTQCSLEFHDIIAGATHNWAIVANLRAIREIIGRSHVVGNSHERRARALAAHEAIFDAIQRRESSESVQLMQQHLRLTLESVTRRVRTAELDTKPPDVVSGADVAKNPSASPAPAAVRPTP